LLVASNCYPRTDAVSPSTSPVLLRQTLHKLALCLWHPMFDALLRRLL
jgi:hypothetical protein